MKLNLPVIHQPDFEYMDHRYRNSPCPYYLRYKFCDKLPQCGCSN